ncbi:MAG TPA: diguanylate cyclase [Candidatus Baltobacteraceae bacterium]|nr:diguanylate cyclase [Candidatus Baltobacteraceae bacterium]
MEAYKTPLRGEAGRRLQDELLIDILNHAPDAVAIMDVVSARLNKYVFLYVNSAFESLYLCARADVVGRDVNEFMASRSLAKDAEKTDAMLSEGAPFMMTRAYPRSDGSTLWLEVHFRPIAMENQPLRWIFSARDITSKKLLQDRAMQLSIAVEEGNDLVAISVADHEEGAWVFEYVNEAFTRATGYRPEEIVGETFASIVPPGVATERFTAIRSKLFAGQPVRDEVRFMHKNGRIGTFVCDVKPIADPITGQFTSIVTVFRDITEQRLREARLQFEAEHDVVTGLHNRRYFERMLTDSIAMEQPAAPQHSLIFMDLDGFKQVNDRLGHDTGDEVLRAAAAAFERCVGGNDVLVRWGGDEFAALLFHCHVSSAVRVAESMQAEFQHDPARRWVTASIGVVPVLPGEKPSASIRRADAATYDAKKAGGNRVAVRET